MKTLTGMLGIVLLSVGVCFAQEVIPQDVVVADPVVEAQPEVAIESIDVAEVAEPVVEAVVEAVVEPVVEPIVEAVVEPIKEEVKQEVKMEPVAQVDARKIGIKNPFSAGDQRVTGTVAYFNSRGTMVFINTIGGKALSRYYINAKSKFFVGREASGITGIRIGDTVDIEFTNEGDQAVILNISRNAE